MKNTYRAKPDTKKYILDFAEDFILNYGYQAFSYLHVSRALGVKNAAIHYHFPHKEDLGVALVQRYRRRLQVWVQESNAQNLPGTEKLERLFQLAQRYYFNQQICPSGILSTEYLALPLAMQSESLGFVNDMQTWASNIIQDGAQQGEFHFKGDSHSMAALIFASLQGALQLSRIHPDYLVTTQKQIRSLLGCETT